MRCVLFKVNGELFGIDIQNVVSIERILPITRIPLAPDYLQGIINLRGEIISVLDLAKMLDTTKSSKMGKSNKIVVLKREDYTVGVLVDGDVSIVTFDDESVNNTINTGNKNNNSYIKGITRYGDEMVSILDPIVITTPQGVKY